MDTDLDERQTISFDFSGVLKALRAFSEIYNKLIPARHKTAPEQRIHGKTTQRVENEKYKKALRAYKGI